MFEIRTYVLKKGFRKSMAKENFVLCTDEGFMKYITDTQYINGMIGVLYYGEEVIGAILFAFGISEWIGQNTFICYQIKEYILMERYDNE